MIPADVIEIIRIAKENKKTITLTREQQPAYLK
jgi:hypothetical protein